MGHLLHRGQHCARPRIRWDWGSAIGGAGQPHLLEIAHDASDLCHHFLSVAPLAPKRNETKDKALPPAQCCVVLRYRAVQPGRCELAIHSF